MEWNTGGLVLDFIAPHSLGFRPVVLRPDHVGPQRATSHLGGSAKWSPTATWSAGSVAAVDVRVTAGPEVARLLMQNEGWFYQSVEEKLFDRRDARWNS